MAVLLECRGGERDGDAMALPSSPMSPPVPPFLPGTGFHANAAVPSDPEPRAPSPSEPFEVEDEGLDEASGSLAAREKSCAHCGRTFRKQSKLNQHLLSHTGERPFVCPFPGCGKAYRRREHLKNHSSCHGDTEEERKPFVCGHEGCGAAFSKEHHKKRHEKSHAGGGIYKCGVEGCGEAFPKHKQLVDHLASHAGDGVAIGHVCAVEGCGKTFRTPSKLAKHAKTHEGALSYACGQPGCSEAFAKWSQLQQHLKKDHPIQCLECGKVFTRRDTLKTHMKSHDKNRDLFPCNWPGCTKVLTSILNVHVQASHQGVKRFECNRPGCGSRFAHKHLLARHVRAHEKTEQMEAGKRSVVSRKKRSAAQILTGHIQGDQQS
ncbi:transcription factor IIIA-like protein [Hyaloraphidium curvatum]|nr:transcription factor IIIA-like protein [Hyaloraphidium curvatum]